MGDNVLTDCTLCPRNCHADRTNGMRGYCGVTDTLIVARAALHMWEEPCISGEEGSGTVFFSGCALGCVYCQNHGISKGLAGKAITIERLSDIFLELQNKGANNINLVTPSHYVPQIIEALEGAEKKGLCLPIVYNTSAYEKVETIKTLEGYVDVYLPDFKYFNSDIGKRYSNCLDYFSYASAAVEEMVRQQPNPVFDERGIMEKGVLVRHLMLPGYLDDSKLIIKYLYEAFHDQIYISIMNQYTPLENVAAYPEINRKTIRKDYDELVDYAISLGIEHGFTQEEETALERFIPDFSNEGV